MSKFKGNTKNNLLNTFFIYRTYAYPNKNKNTFRNENNVVTNNFANFFKQTFNNYKKLTRQNPFNFSQSLSRDTKDKKSVVPNKTTILTSLQPSSIRLSNHSSSKIDRNQFRHNFTYTNYGSPTNIHKPVRIKHLKKESPLSK